MIKIKISEGGKIIKKKLLVFSILAVFMLVTISYATAIKTTVEKKESPLYGIRTKSAIRDRLQEQLEKIKTSFIGNRLFFLPFQWLIKLKNRDILSTSDKAEMTCYRTNCGNQCSWDAACTIEWDCPPKTSVWCLE